MFGSVFMASSSNHFEEGHKQLCQDYFNDNPTFTENLFRRRFRMNKGLFLRIVNRLSAEVPYFQPKKDATFRNGISPLQQCTAAIRQLAYGAAADSIDEYVRIGKTTARQCLEHFVVAIVDLFGTEYLCRPTPDDLERLLFYGEQRGFPGMVGSIDCMHWKWKNCPTAWKGMYSRGTDKPTIVLEAVASQDLWIWHAFFGAPEHQEGARKDVERAFEVLQSSFTMVKNSCRFLKKGKITYIMRACLILHNMIVEDERYSYSLYDKEEFEQDKIHTFSVEMPTNLAGRGEGHTRIRDREAHHQLRENLIENIWTKFGH